MTFFIKIFLNYNRFPSVYSKICFSHFHTSVSNILRRKYDIDYSKVPVLNEKDLSEQFVRGSGPGGQAVNKTSNCCVLLHVPTGLRVKCHETRYLEINRQRAREILIDKLDVMTNGTSSVTAQKKRIDEKRARVKNRQREKLAELKRQWQIRENLL